MAGRKVAIKTLSLLFICMLILYSVLDIMLWVQLADVLSMVDIGHLVSIRMIHLIFYVLIHRISLRTPLVVAAASLSVALPARATFAELSSAPQTKTTPVMG